MIIFVYLIADIKCNYYSNNILQAELDTTAAVQASTIYRRVKHGLTATTYGAQRLINSTGLTSWTFTRWRDQHTSDKVAHYSIYRPQNDERLSWHSWLTYSGRFTHISGHPSAAGRARVRGGTGKVRRSKTSVTQTIPSWPKYLMAKSEDENAHLTKLSPFKLAKAQRH